MNKDDKLNLKIWPYIFHDLWVQVSFVMFMILLVFSCHELYLLLSYDYLTKVPWFSFGFASLFLVIILTKYLYLHIILKNGKVTKGKVVDLDSYPQDSEYIVKYKYRHKNRSYFSRKRICYDKAYIFDDEYLYVMVNERKPSSHFLIQKNNGWDESSMNPVNLIDTVSEIKNENIKGLSVTDKSEKFSMMPIIIVLCPILSVILSYMITVSIYLAMKINAFVVFTSIFLIIIGYLVSKFRNYHVCLRGINIKGLFSSQFINWDSISSLSCTKVPSLFTSLLGLCVLVHLKNGESKKLKIMNVTDEKKILLTLTDHAQKLGIRID